MSDHPGASTPGSAKPATHWQAIARAWHAQGASRRHRRARAGRRTARRRPTAPRPADRVSAPHPGPLRVPVGCASRRARRGDEDGDGRGVRSRHVLSPLRRGEGRRARRRRRSPCASATPSPASWRDRKSCSPRCRRLLGVGRPRAARAVRRPLRDRAGGGGRTEPGAARDSGRGRGAWLQRRATRHDALRTRPSRRDTSTTPRIARPAATRSRPPASAGERQRADVIAVMEDSGLRGLGGAGFPAGRKWKIVAAEPAPRLMAINIDEGEPGTFKDRYYLERDPHRFLEGAIIAAWAVGIDEVYIYLRDEYHGCRAILRARARGAAGESAVPDSGVPSAPRRRRLHLRRRVRDDRVDRGQARRAAAASARTWPRSGCSAARRSSTTWRRSTGCATSSRRAPAGLPGTAGMAARDCARSR